MSSYSITFARSARKELELLDVKVVKRVFQKIEELSKIPRPVDCKKLIGERNLWRIRVGDYRVVYSIYDTEKKIDIITIRHRKDVYK